MFIIALSIDILNFLEKDYGFYVHLRVIIKERLKSCDKFFIKNSFHYYQCESN